MKSKVIINIRNKFSLYTTEYIIKITSPKYKYLSCISSKKIYCYIKNQNANAIAFSLLSSIFHIYDKSH